MLPTDAKQRKETPVYSGVIKYFPDALIAVAALSRAGNEQHNPGKPLHWDRSKSGDEKDALMRHLIEAGTMDTDGQRHSAKVAWRALANLQKEIEDERSGANNPQRIVERRERERRVINGWLTPGCPARRVLNSNRRK